MSKCHGQEPDCQKFWSGLQTNVVCKFNPTLLVAISGNLCPSCYIDHTIAQYVPNICSPQSVHALIPSKKAQNLAQDCNMLRLIMKAANFKILYSTVHLICSETKWVFKYHNLWYQLEIHIVIYRDRNRGKRLEKTADIIIFSALSVGGKYAHCHYFSRELDMFMNSTYSKKKLVGDLPQFRLTNSIWNFLQIHLQLPWRVWVLADKTELSLKHLLMWMTVVRDEGESSRKSCLKDKHLFFPIWN